MELSTLDFPRLPYDFLTYFGQVWAPWLPKLEVLDMGEYDLFYYKEEFFLKILNAAPNLKKIKGTGFDSGIFDFIPEDKYSLLDSIWLSIDDEREEQLYSKLALAAPQMSNLYLTASHMESEWRFMRSYVRILENILSSSRKSLEVFTMGCPIFPLDLLSIPPLINVQRMDIITEYMTPPAHLLHVLRSVDYPKLLPTLYKVKVHTNEDRFDLLNPWENNDAAQVVRVRPSPTVKHLEINGDLNSPTCKELSEIFPNVAYLDAYTIRPLDDTSLSSLRDLWEAWPFLESVSLDVCSRALRQNFDAEFLGISSEEVEVLRQVDNESLQKINIVPTRPSLLTLTRIRKLKFRFSASPAEAEVDQDQVFLSKLTGILAFKMMARKSVKIKFVCMDAQASLRLKHLSPFVTLVPEF